MSIKSDEPSPSQLARANRLRLAAEEGARAREDAVKEAIAVRKNMARLKELRLASEAAAMQRRNRKSESVDERVSFSARTPLTPSPRRHHLHVGSSSIRQNLPKKARSIAGSSGLVVIRQMTSTAQASDRFSALTLPRILSVLSSKLTF
jgi:hypothetical protein